MTWGGLKRALHCSAHPSHICLLPFEAPIPFSFRPNILMSLGCLHGFSRSSLITCNIDRFAAVCLESNHTVNINAGLVFRPHPTNGIILEFSQFLRAVWSDVKHTIDVSAGKVFWPNVLIQIGSNLARWQEYRRCSCRLIFLTLPIHLFNRFCIVFWLGGRPGGNNAAFPSM